MPADQTSTREGPGAPRRPLEELCCVNPECADRGRYSAGNLRVRKGKGGGRWQVLKCSTCKKEFSERKGTAMWGSRMAPDKFMSIASHLKEGGGIRSTARLIGASKDGVTSVAIRVGLHAHALHDDRINDITVDEVQLDEKWSFVEKKTEALRPDEPR